MASLELTGFDELNAAFSRIADIPWSVTANALDSMAETAAEKIKSTGESMGVRDPESNVHILDKISTRGNAKQTNSGGYKYITFKGSRIRNGKKTRNAAIAFINEYGRRGQPARPFVSTAMKRYEESIAEPGLEIIGEWIEDNFHE